MCGVAGLLLGKPAMSADALSACAESMAATLRPRGPDSGGLWSDAEAGIALSHRRLAVMDRSAAGAQPMVSACGRYVLSYNGEIYNHGDLRRDLAIGGAIAWRGRSDTETLVELIARHGLEPALRRCIGAFALALWDRRDRSLSLARDRLGEKPLYYGWSEGRLLFGSELKALRAAPGFDNPVDPRALELFLRSANVPAPWSILQHVFKVRPGRIVTFDAQAALASPAERAGRAYWCLAEVAARPVVAEEDDDAAVEDRLAALLSDAVGRQMAADAPVAAFLSGGVDSSLIAALMREASTGPVRTFTIGFDQPGFDEAPYARAVARHLGADHTELYVDAKQIRDAIPALPDIYCEPFADSSQLPTLLLSRLTRQSATVALSGDAGDELFCGYNRYLVPQRMWSAMRAAPAPARRLAARGLTAPPPDWWDRLGAARLGPRVPMLGAKVAKLARMLDGDLSTRAIYRDATEEWRGMLPFSPGSPMTAPVDLIDPPRASAEEAMMQWDAASYLPDDILVKVDRASMACGLEVRVPLLDHRVVEMAWSLPLHFKKRDGQGKWLLRRILSRHVPDQLIDRPKAGFAIPLGNWLRAELRDWAEDLLSPAVLADHPALAGPAIQTRWRQHLAGAHDWSGALWRVLMFQAWSRRWAS